MQNVPVLYWILLLILLERKSLFWHIILSQAKQGNVCNRVSSSKSSGSSNLFYGNNIDTNSKRFVNSLAYFKKKTLNHLIFSYLNRFMKNKLKSVSACCLKQQFLCYWKKQWDDTFSPMQYYITSRWCNGVHPSRFFMQIYLIKILQLNNFSQN